MFNILTKDELHFLDLEILHLHTAMTSPKYRLHFLDFEILHLYTSYDIACVEASSEFKTLVRTMGDHESMLVGLIRSNLY